MEPRTEQLFNANHDFIIAEASRRFGLDQTSVKRLGSFESAVYEICKDGTPYILKASDESHRRADFIRSELDWVNYLAENGASVCNSIESLHGETVETIILPESGEVVSLILFEKAPGEKLTAESCDDALVRTWGECLGQMHALTLKYEPNGVVRRHDWYDDSDLIPADNIEPEVVEKHSVLVARLKALPVEKESYGLVHLDLHHGNFFVENGRLKIFDTDDCHYDYFANDISMPLYYYYRDKKLGQRQVENAKWFLGNLLEGYSRHYHFDRKWFAHIPDFLNLRRMLLYMIIVGENLIETEPALKEYIADFYEGITQDIPVIDIDFATL